MFNSSLQRSIGVRHELLFIHLHKELFDNNQILADLKSKFKQVEFIRCDKDVDLITWPDNKVESNHFFINDAIQYYLNDHYSDEVERITNLANENYYHKKNFK